MSKASIEIKLSKEFIQAISEIHDRIIRVEQRVEKLEEKIAPEVQVQEQKDETKIKADKFRYATSADEITNGKKSINQGRAEYGLNPIENADVHFAKG